MDARTRANRVSPRRSSRARLHVARNTVLGADHSATVNLWVAGPEALETRNVETFEICDDRFVERRRGFHAVAVAIDNPAAPAVDDLDDVGAKR